MYVKDYGQCHWVKTIFHEGKSLITRNVLVKFKSSTFKWLKTYDKLKVKGFRNVGQRFRSMPQGQWPQCHLKGFHKLSLLVRGKNEVSISS